MFERTLKIDLRDHNAAFLWGPRKTGKTTLLRRQFPDAVFYDLLERGLKTRLTVNPSRLRDEVAANKPRTVVVDEIQKVPDLLDEVHWCIENTATRFVLCGSSARKLRRGAANLLGGRAWRFELFPLTTAEIAGPDLGRILNHGLVPRHYLEARPERSLDAYVTDYINEEIQAEALTRNIPAFARFLEAVALTHGELTNYSNIARDCGVSHNTVREYYQILDDTLLGHSLQAWRRSRSRRLIETAKFYLFDPGVVRALKGMPRVQPRTEEFGRAFEHFMIEEVRAYISYRERRMPIAFWRTSTGFEVDLVVGQMDAAIEFKATDNVKPAHLRGLQALSTDEKVRAAFLVCLEQTPRKTAGVLVLPWLDFCRRLWAGEIF
ncbi:MAG: ATP-binding protein [Deltaproteobacteria bacterium]|nr:ATP-binding protein [Deltaproteobacteria bacterium]